MKLAWLAVGLLACGSSAPEPEPAPEPAGRDAGAPLALAPPQSGADAAVVDAAEAGTPTACACPGGYTMCGSHLIDGCGVIDCGPCADGEVCEGEENKGYCCKPMLFPELCGKVSDGCGGVTTPGCSPGYACALLVGQEYGFCAVADGGT